MIEKESIARWLAIALLRLLFAELCSAATRSDKTIFEADAGVLSGAVAGWCNKLRSKPNLINCEKGASQAYSGHSG